MGDNDREYSAKPIGPGEPAVPTKCVACQREMSSTPVVCDYCHTLNPVAGPMDYFQLLGVERRYDLDPEDLRRKYLSLNRHAHPDFHTDETPESRDLSLQVSSALNNAYRTLVDPVSRAEYLLELLGGKSSAQDKTVPPNFLGEIMMLREEIEQARSGDQGQTLGRLKGELHERLSGMTGELSEQFKRFDATVACEATRLDELDRIRLQLNAISYIRRMLSQLE